MPKKIIQVLVALFIFLVLCFSLYKFLTIGSDIDDYILQEFVITEYTTKYRVYAVRYNRPDYVICSFDNLEDAKIYLDELRSLDKEGENNE